MPGSADSDTSFIELNTTPGGGMRFTVAADGTTAAGWAMTHSQALTLAARILALYGYREMHLIGDDRRFSAS